MSLHFSESILEVKKIKTDYIEREEMGHLLSALMPTNRLILEVSLSTGLRLGDVLNLKTEHLKERMTIREQKTGKTRRIRLTKELLDRLITESGKIYVFPNRLDYRKPRTRQAVWKDLKRVAKLFRIPAKLNIAPHSVRKVYAVGEFRRTCNIKRVQELLNHSDEAVTWIYASADVLAHRKCPHYFADKVHSKN